MFEPSFDSSQIHDLVEIIPEDVDEENHTAEYSSLQSLGVEIRCRGGQVTNIVGPWTTHIILQSEQDYPISQYSPERRQFFIESILLNYPMRHSRRPHIIKSDEIRAQINRAAPSYTA
jgi:hypothetical protein